MANTVTYCLSPRICIDKLVTDCSSLLICVHKLVTYCSSSSDDELTPRMIFPAFSAVILTSTPLTSLGGMTMLSRGFNK